MREIDVKIVKETVKKLFLNANFYLDKKIKNKIHYDHLVFFEVLPLKNEINGYEIMTEMLFKIKIKPRCDIICVADTIENRINHILNKIISIHQWSDFNNTS